MNVTNKQIKWNKSFECVALTIGLQSLLPKKSTFAFQKVAGTKFRDYVD